MRSDHIRVYSPAKINLGLEILGRREDGYHEIRSILSMVDVTDDLEFSLAPSLPDIQIDWLPGDPPEDNLIVRAILLFQQHTGFDTPVHVRVVKRIPTPGGLGSASSNAASTLLALNWLHKTPLSTDALHTLGARLGSDVPFFLGSPTALVSDTGTTLTPVPPPAGWALVAVPQIDLPSKTAQLYGMLTPEEFSDGTTVDTIVHDLRQGHPISPALLVNAFERPLRKAIPYSRRLVQKMHDAGCHHVALSGAGPAHYTLFAEEHTAHEVRRRLVPMLGPHDYVVTAAFRHQPLAVEPA